MLTAGRALALIFLAIAAVAPAASAEHVATCNIGKPLYCLKYAQMFCPKQNTMADREAACPAWQQACFDCHAKIPACLGGERPPMKSEQCVACTAEWRQCMHRIDAKFWPNRRKH